MEYKESYEYHNYGLDYLRIFAMLGVLLVHVTIYVNVQDTIRKYFSWGACGVQIFFVLSGYLALLTYNQEQRPIVYYKKRAIRILPAYYIGILLMIFIDWVITGGVHYDIWGLKWIRYFLGLNTVLPSNDYDIWNNFYGYWTMSCFIYFYIMVPLIVKWIKSLKKAIMFYITCFGIFAIWKLGLTLIFLHIEGIDRLNNVIGASPFGMLYYFALGIIAYWAIKEQKQNAAMCVFLITGIVGLIIGKNAWVWAIFTSMLIIVFEDINLKSKNQLWNKIVICISKQSMYIYLAHLMSFDLCWYIVNGIKDIMPFQRYIIWGITSFFCISFEVWMMNMADKFARKIIIQSKERGKG